MAMLRAAIEGSMVVEMANGEHRIILHRPIDGMVVHNSPGAGFAPAMRTPEAAFRRNVKRVVSRSPYDTRN